MKGVAARSFSWTAFVASNIVIDFESLYYLSRDEWPVHRRLHTFLGAGLVGVGVAVAMVAATVLLPRRWRQASSSARQAEISRRGIVTGALIGALSHPLLDGIMHSDIEPFKPMSA